MVKRVLLSVLVLAFAAEGVARASDEDGGLADDARKRVDAGDVSGSDLGKKEDWQRHGFGSPEFHVVKSHLDPKDPKFSLRLRLVIVTIKGSDWSMADVQEQFEIMAKTYSQCGLYLEDAPVVYARSPLGHAKLNPDKKEDVRLAESLPTDVRPLMFFGGKHSAASEGFSYNAESFERDPNLSRSVLNVAFLDQTVIPRNDHLHMKNYLAPGHELAHILLNAGHNTDEETNILTVDPPRFFNAHLTASQCKKLKFGPGVSSFQR